jgi:hypothetical protein
LSIECGECERDLRGGHDPSCSRYKPSHTPGPWTFDGPPDSIIVWSGPDHRVCFLTSNGPTEANACLIALAPELYEYVRSSASNGCATAQALIARL